MKPKVVWISVAVLAGMALAFLSAKSFLIPQRAISIVPQPEKVEVHGGSFRLQPNSRIISDSPETGEYLAKYLRVATGYPLPVGAPQATSSGPGNIILSSAVVFTNADTVRAANKESYELTVLRETVAVRAPDTAGLFYGVQTLLQLLPPEIFSRQAIPGKTWEIPCVQIHDRPRFGWRGFLLDSARHFFTKQEIKEVLDLMALHKLNMFQWHLTDDQGWRIEIKKYPRLTEVGAWRKHIGFGLDPKSSTAYGPDGRYGGFYTQADIRELVAYAQARHITIVPEIEMPGHAGAALSAYPEFSCSGGPFNTDIEGNVPPGVFCPGNDATFAFLQDVLEGVCELFPGRYVHIGGDEVSKESWKNCPKCQARIKAEGLRSERELQSYFVKRIEKALSARGKTLVGWSEIREGGLAQNAVVMDWIGGAEEAARAGHDVVMTPTEYCYLDYYQSTNHAAEPRAIGGFIPLEKVYSFEPVPAGLEPQYHAHILGPQGNLWTEYIPSLRHAEYMAFPRLCALAEVAWSPAGQRNYADFERRLRVHCGRLTELGVNFRK